MPGKRSTAQTGTVVLCPTWFMHHCDITHSCKRLSVPIVREDGNQHVKQGLFFLLSFVRTDGLPTLLVDATR